MRQEEVRRQNRLRFAEMGVGRHGAISTRLGLARQRSNQPAQAQRHVRDVPLQVEPQIERHLFVARTPGVQPLARLADALDELPFDKRVDILVWSRHKRRIAAAGLEHLGKAASDGLGRVRRDGASAGQGFGPRQAAGHIVLEQVSIERQRHAKREDGRVGVLVEPSGP